MSGREEVSMSIPALNRVYRTIQERRDNRITSPDQISRDIVYLIRNVIHQTDTWKQFLRTVGIILLNEFIAIDLELLKQTLVLDRNSFTFFLLSWKPAVWDQQFKRFVLRVQTEEELKKWKLFHIPKGTPLYDISMQYSDITPTGRRVRYSHPFIITKETVYSKKTSHVTLLSKDQFDWKFDEEPETVIVFD